MNLRDELASMARELPGLEGATYRNVYDLVAREGLDFAPREVPADLRRRRARRPKDCYYRAFTVALDRDDLLYVEGFALTELGSVQHAWLTDGSGCAIDLAWRDPAVEYVGVPLVTASVARVVVATDWIGEYLSTPALLRDGFGPATLQRA